MKKNKITITFNSPVVLTYVLLCFAATLLNYLTAGRSNTLLFSTYHSSLLNPLTYVRFFTHVIGHSGWEHVINNSMYLLLLGPALEEKHGSKMMITVIAVTALVTGLVNYIFFPNIALCGASGVVFAFILLISFTGMNGGEVPLTFILIAVIFLGQQIYQGVFVEDNISNMAHIVGGVTGSVFGFALNRGKGRRKR
ncbi:MAG: rhomboid family intramembrane serine protease [Lachnospiraceae bacterium]|nr:rhomboid family intramembrane serine protease [Lachnospiraceae bacterium]